MEKAARGPQPRAASKQASDEFLTKVDAATSLTELNSLWEEAHNAGFSEEVRSVFTGRKKALNGSK
jgi:hypothetical protein